MQYLLTKEEYDALHTRKEEHIALEKKKLQKLCTKIANEMPVVWGWGGPDPKPWGCYLTARENDEEWYCDKCPVQEICPSDERDYSK